MKIPSTSGFINIVGSNEFKKQVESSLILLSQKAPQVYKIVCKYIGEIRESERSGMAPFTNPPIFFLSPKSAFYSITWCASIIAHDAYHSKLYHDNKKKYGKRVPYDIWSGFIAEKNCIAFQLVTLIEINAPQHEIDYCISLDGTHADVNKDGKIDINDYNLRDW